MRLRQLTPPRYLPLFSSTPGVKISIPGSSYVVQAFPTALRLFLCRQDGLDTVRDVTFPKLGPVQGWRVLLDAMRRILCIEGRGPAGFFRLRLDLSSEGLSMRSMKGPVELHDHELISLKKNESLVLGQSPVGPRSFPMPRLILGCNKAFNWDRISALPDMSEVLPLWYQFGYGGLVADEPPSTLFGVLLESIREKKRVDIFPAFDALFRAGTEGMFVPKKIDDLFLGYALPAWPEGMELSTIQAHVCSLIRSLFLTEEGAVVDLLPCLPKECVCGRLLHEGLASGHTISIEWRKGVLRRMFMKAAHDGLVTFKASARSGYIRSLRTPMRKRPFLLGEPLEVRQGEEYLLDNFQLT